MATANLRKDKTKNKFKKKIYPELPETPVLIGFFAALLHVGTVSLKVYDVLQCVLRENSVRFAAKQVPRAYSSPMSWVFPPSRTVIQELSSK
jgi:hypothetical protein